MNVRKSTLWVAQTGIFLALLVALQWATSSMSTFVTGSIVNLILVLSVMLCGLWSGVTVAALSPVFAVVFGIMVRWELAPFVMIGNVAFVAIWFFIGNLKTKEQTYLHVLKDMTALILAAVVKFMILWLGIVHFVAPVILELPAAAPVYFNFSWPQLVTALIGGSVALNLLPVMKKTFRQTK